MSLAETLHAEHKARQARLGNIPRPRLIHELRKPSPKKYEPVRPRKNAATINPEPYYRGMWFWQLVNFKPRTDGVARPTLKRILECVAHRYDISMTEILSHRRLLVVVRPRQMAMYLAREMTLRTLPEIGRFMSGRDHTTVIHAVRKIEHMISISSEMRKAIDELKQEILSA